LDIYCEIKGLKYTPKMCRELRTFNIVDIDDIITPRSPGTFLLNIEDKQICVSRWVSPKRTRSYPYARVYDSMEFSGKKVTIIPVIKDEGREGDRDYLQWDTISLMSILGVFVIISYYSNASKSNTYDNKITNQLYDVENIKSNIDKIINYQSDALHWNISQIDKIKDIGEKAINAYQDISEILDVEMHSLDKAKRRIDEIREGKENFMKLSRDLASEARNREVMTEQPKEFVNGEKCGITIKNYLGGVYFLTCDEFVINNSEIYLIESKHTSIDTLPSLSDIKDGLLKMVLFTNLEEINLDEKNYTPVPVLKLTSGVEDIKYIENKNEKFLNSLKNEAETNNFRVIINDEFYV
jgi:hypothetical protein